MSASRLLLLTAILFTSVNTSECRAQAYGLEDVVANNDLNWFEPTDLDLDGRMETEAGYFFRYDKLALHFSGEKVELGDPNIQNSSEPVYGTADIDLVQSLVNQFFVSNPGVAITAVEQAIGVTLDPNPANAIPVQVADGNGGFTQVDVPPILTIVNSPPTAYQVRNSILDATPDAAIGWGERYEIGYSDGERGWLVGILDGPEASSGGTFGAGEGSPYTSQAGNGTAGLDPFYLSDLTDDNGDGIPDNPGDTFDLYALGFGSVAVNFSAPESFFVGFRDYQINSSPTSGTVTGPINYVGNYGSIDDNEDFTNTTVTRIADDLNGNGQSFFLVLADLDGDGTIDDDEIIGTFIDFGDLYEFDVFFDEVNVRNRTELDGIEIMLTHDLKTSHKLDRGRRDSLQLRYGVNFLRLRDDFAFEGLGSILGRTSVDHEIDNQIVGPQIGLRWRRDHGAWDISLDGRFTFGYNIVDHTQSGIFGEELIPGALNRPILGRTTTSVDTKRDDDFSPLGELRAEARYKITKALALKVGYTAKFIDNVRRSSESVDWTAPYFQIKDGKSDIFINGVNFGIEFRH